MSEGDTSFSGIDEEEKEEGLESDLDADESVDSMEQPGLEQEKEEEEDEEEEPTTVGGIRDEDEDEDEEVGELEVVEVEEEPRPVSRRSQRRKRAKVKEPEPSVANIEKQLEKQANNLTRLEQELQPLRKLAKSSEMQSKVIKDINSSVKQLGKQIIQIQKAIQKDKRKGTRVEKVKTRSKSKPKPKPKPKPKSKDKGRSRRK